MFRFRSELQAFLLPTLLRYHHLGTNCKHVKGEECVLEIDDCVEKHEFGLWFSWVWIPAIYSEQP